MTINIKSELYDQYVAIKLQLPFFLNISPVEHIIIIINMNIALFIA